MLHSMTSYCGKLTGEDLSRYLNGIESVGLRKAYYCSQIGDLTVSAANVYTSLPYNMAAKMLKLRHCHAL